MNDAKITKQEYAIRNILSSYNFPYKLVSAPHGLWAEGQAIIALEHV